MKAKPLLILDMDGVLVDVSDSYREVIRSCVVLYLSEFIGAEIKSGEFIKPHDVAEIKQSGGLNNDWELTYTIIDTILKRYFDKKNNDLFDAFHRLKNESDDKKLLSASKKILKGAHRALLESELGKTPIAVIYFEEKEKSTSPFLMNRNDVGSGNLVKRMFQELYLGEPLFRKHHSSDPIFYSGRGYIEHEILIPSIRQLKELGRFCALAIATGRPFAEAVYTLERFAIKEFFSVLVTEDDVEKAQQSTNEQLRKPHPFMIESCIKKSGYKAGETIIYVGDMPDDIEAALRAGVLPLGFVFDSKNVSLNNVKAHRDFIREKGAVEVFGNFNEVIGYLKEKYT